MLRCIFGVFLLLTTGFAQEPSRMDQVVQSYVSDKQFMGSVLVARGDQVLFRKSYGSANLEWDIPNTSATKFRIGSITKQFTAAAILLLEERGKLNIEDLIKKYLTDAPAPWDKVTIFHLLTHTAGIPNITTFPELPKLTPFPHTPEQLVALFRDKPLEFMPGEKMQYSNSGYILLGYLIEKVSGESYQNFTQENIFDPLGMKDSGYDSNSAIIPRRAAGYYPSENGPMNAEFIHMSIPFSGGALYSTCDDLLRWEQGLFGGKLLSVASLVKMTTPYKNGYGFGVEVNTVNGRKQISHGGGIQGFNTFLSYFPEDKLTVAVLGNLNGGALPEIAGLLANLAHGEKVVLISELKAITLSPKVLEQYVGTYQLQPGINVMIAAENGQLMVEGLKLEGPLSASSETLFFSKKANAQLEFSKDEKGVVTNLILRQRGTVTKASRISDKVVARKEIMVSPIILAQYVGTYRLLPEIDLVFTLENEKFMVHPTALPLQRAEVFAESPTQFFLKVSPMQFEFIKDENGATAYLLVRLGPSKTIKVPRIND